MRLWSLHPKYLDAKGLVALWREGLLAKKVLEGKTRGYTRHPQLIRFRKCKKPLTMINHYLHVVCDEAESRGYQFDRSKLSERSDLNSRSYVTNEQIKYEWTHLMGKLLKRDADLYRSIKKEVKILPHPLFKTRPGKIESWEII